MPYFKIHILKLAYHGKCQRFIATHPVQKVLEQIWKTNTGYRLVEWEVNLSEVNLRKNYSVRNVMHSFRNVMHSPCSRFVYDTTFYLMFLLIFSYYMLSKTKFELKESCRNATNHSNNRTFPKCTQIVADWPIWIDNLLIVWIFSFMCHEIREVNNKLIS